MKSSYKLILIGTIITGLWLSGLVWMQITQTSLDYVGNISIGTSLEQGVEIKTVRVSPQFSMIPVTGIFLLGLGIFYAVWDKRK